MAESSPELLEVGLFTVDGRFTRPFNVLLAELVKLCDSFGSITLYVLGRY
jgi:hypothetical protein